MTQFIEFPQRQHQEFRNLVFKSVLEAARRQVLSLEDYFAAIYYSGENPQLFASAASLQSLYQRFQSLIELAVSTDPEALKLTEANKAYLCYRIYVHSLCMQRQNMSESDAELYLQDALQEYFNTATKVFSDSDRLKILGYLKRMRQHAPELPR
tara:strand:- start:631 stop:1092 length:462 start_codon:yes stop_codon:yes gene_type:complete